MKLKGEEKTMKKRVVAALLAAVVALGLVACGNTGTQQGGNNTENSTEQGTENKKQDLSNITDTMGINDQGSYVVEGNKITATVDKAEWSFFSYLIKEDAKAMNAVKIEIEDATAGTEILLKLEGGDGRAVEKKITLAGGAQTIIWNVSADNFASDGNGRLLIHRLDDIHHFLRVHNDLGGAVVVTQNHKGKVCAHLTDILHPTD